MREEKGTPMLLGQILICEKYKKVHLIYVLVSMESLPIRAVKLVNFL